MSSGILIYAQTDKSSTISPIYFELVSKARELSMQLHNCPVKAVILTNKSLSKENEELFKKYGADKVFVLKNTILKDYSTEIYTKLIVDLVKELDPEIFLIGATEEGRDLAPRVSAALNTGLTADCTKLEINESHKLAATRPTFGGKLMAVILSKTFPQMATVREHVFLPVEYYKDSEFIYKDIDLQDIKTNIQILETQDIPVQTNCLYNAKIIVAAGKGIKNKSGFKILKEFANVLGAQIGASRGAIEMGIVPKELQIGQSGQTVHPDIYIACGISGAIQHTCGIENSKQIIAINSDKNAPIFKVSDIGIIGDVFEIIPQLTEMLKNKD